MVCKQKEQYLKQLAKTTKEDNIYIILEQLRIRNMLKVRLHHTFGI